MLLPLGIVLSSLSGAYGQAPANFPTATPDVRTGSDLKTRIIINPVFATGMKCDAVTDDSAALQVALTAAGYPGVGNATVIMPPGTCIIDPAAGVSINSSLWLQGAGRFGTTLRRKNTSAGSQILLINCNGITLSDFAIDGNKGGYGIATATDSIAALAPFRGITIQRMRFANSTSSDIASHVAGAGGYTAGWLVADNDFESQGNPFEDCGIIICGNILLQQPLGVRIIGNRSDNSQEFALFSSIPGAGQIDIGDNVITNLSGFGVALGGGVLGAAGAHIHDNFITSTDSDGYNLIDLAFWNDFTVDHNIMYHRGGNTHGIANACIADFPPANHGEVDGNICYSLPTVTTNMVGIGLGGSDISITNKFIQGASTAGISFAVGSQGPAKGVRIIGNTTKNNNQQNIGAHAGIELFLGSGAPDLSGLSDVIIQGNHSYDDQTPKSQAYGIAISLYGVTTRYSNIVIENNDVVGNSLQGIQINAVSIPGLVIRNNFGYNPVGAITAPAFPASGTELTNTTGFDVTLYITSGTYPIGVAINGTTLTGVLVPGGSAASGPIRVPANQNITLTYTAGGTPSWQWIAD